MRTHRVMVGFLKTPTRLGAFERTVLSGEMYEAEAEPRAYGDVMVQHMGEGFEDTAASTRPSHSISTDIFTAPNVCRLALSLPLFLPFFLSHWEAPLPPPLPP